MSTSTTRLLAGVWERQWEEDPLGCKEDKIDRSTMVVWHQTPSGIYVDLRLPLGAPGRRVGNSNRVQPEALLANGRSHQEYTQEERSTILEQKSFAGKLQCSLGDTTANNGQALKEDAALAELAKADNGLLPLCTCFWVREIDYQPPSHGLDIGVCASGPVNADGTVDMRETGADATYAEGWRRVAKTQEGPFVALELVSENGKEHARKGFWVRTGNRFAYAVGRPEGEDAATSLACPLLSPKVKECKGLSLGEAVNSIAKSKIEEMAIAASYVGLVGEVKDDGSWLIDASSLSDLVGCTLVDSKGLQGQLRCSTLCSAVSKESSNVVEEGQFVDQTICSGKGNVVRRWKIVELSSPTSLPLILV